MRCWRSLQNKEPLSYWGRWAGWDFYRILLIQESNCDWNLPLQCFSKNLPLWDPRSGSFGHFESPTAQHSCSSAHPDRITQVSLPLAGEGWSLSMCKTTWKAWNLLSQTQTAPWETIWALHPSRAQDKSWGLRIKVREVLNFWESTFICFKATQECQAARWRFHIFMSRWTNSTFFSSISYIYKQWWN